MTLKFNTRTGTGEAQCDKCPDTVDIEADSFTGAVAALRKDRWHIRIVDGEWIHHCVDCVLEGVDF